MSVGGYSLLLGRPGGIGWWPRLGLAALGGAILWWAALGSQVSFGPASQPSMK